MKPHPLDSPEAGPGPRPPEGPIRTVLLFCGSRTGTDQRHAALAAAVGRLLAARGVRLVYGGGALGLMGEAGRAGLAAGGEVQGIIPQFLMDWEVAEPLCADMTVTDSLHGRKMLMFERADAVLALPGGLGTLDELVEVLSWRNLRLHAKPVWLMGDGEFWAPFIALLRHLVAQGFAGPDVLTHVQQVPDSDALAALLSPS
ncbi:MAG: TIGR00730 family Rossman fold protein [Sandaracinobacteroides sp.]